MRNKIIIGIDASNILRGGGRTHLLELLNEYNTIFNYNINIIIWGKQETLDLIPDNDVILKRTHKYLEKGILYRSFWQLFHFSPDAKKLKCNIIFIPGGSYFGNFRPRVVMCQNMLPFELKELFRFGFSFLTIKLLILRIIHKNSFKNSDGVIFLSHYAKNTIQNQINGFSGVSKIIPHGINDKFNKKPAPQKDIKFFTNDNPYKIIYVSIIDQYKHQWNVIEAISELRKTTGWPLELELIGPAYTPALIKLNKSINIFDPNKTWVKYNGEISYKTLQNSIFKADMGIFASSCENMPNILMEKMHAGLPMVCSNKGPMPEFLKDHGLFFNPDNPLEIKEAIYNLIISKDLRTKLSISAYIDSLQYTWKNCGNATFEFLKEIAENKNHK